MTDKLNTNLMEGCVAQLEKAQQRFDRNNQISIPKIQRVPKFLRGNQRFYRYCTPKLISFGPIHHDSDNVKEAEHYKLLWTSKFVAEYGRKIDQDTNRACRLLFKKIEDNIEELETMFTEDAIGNYARRRFEFAWMLFVDGCSLIHFMDNVDDQCPEALNLKLDQLMYMWRDVELLENQLPMKLLEILCEEKGINLAYLLNKHQSLGGCKRYEMVWIPLEDPKPFHILDSSRSIYLPPHMVDNTKGDNKMETQLEGNEHNQMEINAIVSWNTYKSIRDLKTAGIRVMANKIDQWNWSNISFSSKWLSGELRLPVFLFNDVTPYFFRNLIAFEMCPDVHYNYECCSFFSFMDSLIDTAEDVKELRLAGVFQNLLGSDEELAKLFNELGDDLPTKMCCNISSSKVVTYSKKYLFVRHQIQKHYTNRWRTWLAQAYNTHFNTPWAMVAFLAASLALVLTIIQTWFAIHPK